MAVDAQAAAVTRPEFEYVGFWKRFAAFLIDSVALLAIMLPLLLAVYGWSYFDKQGAGFAGTWDFLVQFVLPAVAAILFWIIKGATPGKMAISAAIVDAKTGKAASNGALVLRYFAYFISCLPFFLGFAWIAFDRRKQGFHDKIAGTLVVYNKDPK
ncbi:MAG: RDD family protein [Betaproteobacteria bacterium]|nr:RDD family protein [Betaproteobacteria bacterium]